MFIFCKICTYETTAYPDVLCMLIYKCLRMYNPGDISTTPTAVFDYETQNIYLIEVTAHDGEFEDVQRLTIYVDNVNEKPYFIPVRNLANVLETETTSRVVLSADALDPETDVLNYEIIGSIPSGAPFSIDNNNGIFSSRNWTCHVVE